MHVHCNIATSRPLCVSASHSSAVSHHPKLICIWYIVLPLAQSRQWSFSRNRHTHAFTYICITAEIYIYQSMPQNTHGQTQSQTDRQTRARTHTHTPTFTVPGASCTSTASPPRSFSSSLSTYETNLPRPHSHSCTRVQYLARSLPNKKEKRYKPNGEAKNARRRANEAKWDACERRILRWCFAGGETEDGTFFFFLPPYPFSSLPFSSRPFPSLLIPFLPFSSLSFSSHPFPSDSFSHLPFLIQPNSSHPISSLPPSFTPLYSSRSQTVYSSVHNHVNRK